MAQERLSVRKIIEVLRLKWACGLTNRAVGRSCGVSSQIRAKRRDSMA